MADELLVVTAGNSKILELIPERFRIHVSSLNRTEDFKAVPKNISLIIFDLENEKGLPEQLLGIRGYLPMRDIPIWGFLKKKNIKSMNLFFSFGGSRILNEGELASALKHPPPPLPTPETSGLETAMPSMSQAAKYQRLIEQLDFIQMKQWLSELKRSNLSLHSTMEGILERITKLVSPHLVIILLNSNQQADAFIKPSEIIFKQDYNDFMNFCLNDFYVHFQSLNLENINESFFTGNRDDFNKINMTRQKISSYIFFPIKNQNGEVEATVHLGHLMNNYFSEKLTDSVQRFLNAMSGSFFYALREHQIKQRREKILNIFERFVPADIIPDLISREHSKEYDKVEKREITILFSDIRSFTSITEQNGAQQVVDFLNRHFNVMVSIIKKYGGSIDKFIGDAIVAIFDNPENLNENSLQAARAAIEMIDALPTVDCSELSLKDDNYGIGIGIHEGAAIIGNVGSAEKADYTAIGDVTGIAEELEALTKNYPTHILLSEKAKKSIGGNLNMILQDTISLGNENAMQIYSPQKGSNDAG